MHYCGDYLGRRDSMYLLYCMHYYYYAGATKQYCYYYCRVKVWCMISQMTTKCRRGVLECWSALWLAGLRRPFPVATWPIMLPRHSFNQLQ